MDREDGIIKTPGDSCAAAKPWKWTLNGSQVARDQDPTVFCRDPQDFRIESAIRDYARSRAEVYRRLSAEQSFPNVGIDVGVSLKADLQASLGVNSFLARSKRSIIS
jgi:hypothetical protein